MQGQFKSQNALIDQLRTKLIVLKKQNEDLTKENIYLRQNDRMVAQALPLGVNGMNGYHIWYSHNGQAPDESPTNFRNAPLQPMLNPLSGFTPNPYDPSLVPGFAAMPTYGSPHCINESASNGTIRTNSFNSMSWSSQSVSGRAPSLPMGASLLTPIGGSSGKNSGGSDTNSTSAKSLSPGTSKQNPNQSD